MGQFPKWGLGNLHQTWPPKDFKCDQHHAKDDPRLWHQCIAGKYNCM